MRVAPAIKLNDEERKSLQTIARSPRQPLRLVQRAKIVLLADQGLENIEIAERVNVSMALVGRWRRRYAESSFTGIEKDKTRPPGKPKTLPGIVQVILDKTMQETPPAQTHWSQHGRSRWRKSRDCRTSLARTRPQATSYQKLGSFKIRVGNRALTHTFGAEGYPCVKQWKA